MSGPVGVGQVPMEAASSFEALLAPRAGYFSSHVCYTSRLPRLPNGGGKPSNRTHQLADDTTLRWRSLSN